MRVRLKNLGGYIDYQGTVTGLAFQETATLPSSKAALAVPRSKESWVHVKWDIPHHPCTSPIQLKHLIPLEIGELIGQPKDKPTSPLALRLAHILDHHITGNQLVEGVHALFVDIQKAIIEFKP